MTSPPTLDQLPTEILFQVLTFLSQDQKTEPQRRDPLNLLAGVNKHLYAVVEEYCRGLFTKHCSSRVPKNALQSRTPASCMRRKWLAETCRFCKRRSERRAVLYPGLTVCRLCDREKFAKLTMTTALRYHRLSKFDLFTPNVLHPHLRPLTAGTYTVMGSPATMILEADVVARSEYICTRLGASGRDRKYMARRNAAHERIAQHLGIYFSGTKGRWVEAPKITNPQGLAKSMLSEEGRSEYVKKNLEKEWQAMGLEQTEGGGLEPIEGWLAEERDVNDPFSDVLQAMGLRQTESGAVAPIGGWGALLLANHTYSDDDDDDDEERPFEDSWKDLDFF